MSNFRKSITENDIKRVPRGKVLVRRSTEVEKSAGGIHLPENKTAKPLQCEVIAIGADRYKDSGVTEPCIFSSTPVKVGDTVSVRQFHGKNLNIEKDLLIVDGRDVEAQLTAAV